MRRGFEELSAGIAAGVRAHDDLRGLVLLGSASADAAARRDEWSDHDFFALIAPGRGPAVRPDLGWLPDQDRIVLTAREGEVGFVALYDDARLCEFALAEAEELSGALVTDATIVEDDADGVLATLVARGRTQAEQAGALDPVNDARLVLVKLLIGVGRVRRGEVLAGGAFIRQWAVQHLLRALRGRAGEQGASFGDPCDPFRRFEQDFPVWGARIADALSRPPEQAARELYLFAREVLEPGWAQFPSRAADVVALRLGW